MITIDDVIQKAKQVGVDVSNNRSSEVWAVDLLEFARQFVINEREACAKVCDEVDNNMEASWKRNAVNCAAAIRERSKHG